MGSLHYNLYRRPQRQCSPPRCHLQTQLQSPWILSDWVSLLAPPEGFDQEGHHWSKSFSPKLWEREEMLGVKQTYHATNSMSHYATMLTLGWRGREERMPSRSKCVTCISASGRTVYGHICSSVLSLLTSWAETWEEAMRRSCWAWWYVSCLGEDHNWTFCRSPRPPDVCWGMSAKESKRPGCEYIYSFGGTMCGAMQEQDRTYCCFSTNNDEAFLISSVSPSLQIC